jgi:hypothetical protein
MRENMMNKADRLNLNRYRFAWINKFNERKYFKIQLFDSPAPTPKSANQHYKGKLKRFLVRLRSD